MRDNTDTSVRVVDHPDGHRFEITVGDVVAGFAAYQLTPGRIVFTHTEIGAAFAGRGLAGRLAAAALDDARGRDLRVVPRCPFIAAFIARHREYADLVQ